MMFEAETLRLLQMRAAARGQSVLLAHIDQALSVIGRLAEADNDNDLDDLEAAVEALAAMVGAPAIRH
ncbi:hypothetical protein [Phenylobacterium sp.]|uniref:hypothetical protein n=1 Tax=Phenylobacterium sp. TaxID=1871053 RepID=UPI00391BD2B1